MGIALSTIVAVALTAGAEAAPDGPVTYAEDIAPIIQNNCLSCHRPGLGTPFFFRDYAEVRRKGKLIAYVTESGYMPPWKPERGYTPLKNERGLSAKQIALIQEWVDQGMPEGDPSKTPEPPEFKTGWRLGAPDIVLEMEGPFSVPADGPDIYHNFVLDIPDLPEGQWLKGIEFRPSAPTVVHHSLFDLDTDGRGRARDQEDPGPGFKGMDQTFASDRIGAYAVGSLPYLYPEGVALEIPDDSDLILETHFHPSGKAEEERSKVGLYLTDEPPTRHMVDLQVPVSFGITTGLDIPPGESDYTLRRKYKIPVDVDVFHVFPHAHYLCREMKAVARFPDGSKQVLIWIKDWDFGWQEQYMFEEPVRLPAGTVYDMTFVYDNSADNPYNPSHPPQRVKWGPFSTDEMASLGISVMTVNPEETGDLRQAFYSHQKREYRQVPLDIIQPIMIAEIMRRFDHNDDGEIGLLETIAMGRYWAAETMRSRGHPSFEAQRILVRRAIDPYVDTHVRGLIQEKAALGGSLTVATLAAAILGFIFWRRRKQSLFGGGPSA